MEKVGETLERMEWKQKLRDFKSSELPSLKRIPEPPDAYKEWRCLIQGIEDRSDLMDKKRNELNKKIEGGSKQVFQYESRLERIRAHNLEWAEIVLAVNRVSFTGDGICPIEKREIRAADGKKHGEVEWGLITGFDFWRIEEKIKGNKLYLPLHPESERYDLLRSIFGERKELSLPGDPEKMGYPAAWDEVEEGQAQEAAMVDDF